MTKIPSIQLRVPTPLLEDERPLKLRLKLLSSKYNTWGVFSCMLARSRCERLFSLYRLGFVQDVAGFVHTECLVHLLEAEASGEGFINMLVDS